MRIEFVNPHNSSNMYAAPKFFRYASNISSSLNFRANGALFPPLNLAILAALTPREHTVAIAEHDRRHGRHVRVVLVPAGGMGRRS